MNTRKQLLKDFLAAFSYVNICFIRIWYPLVIPAANFYQGRPPNYSDYAALLLNIFSLSLLLLFFIRKIKSAPKVLQYISIYLLGLFLIYRSQQLGLPFIYAYYTEVIVLFSCLLAICILSKPFSHYCIRFAYFAFVAPSVFWIYFVLTAPLYIHNVHTYLDSIRKTQEEQTFASNGSTKRLIWITYDELDQNYIFDRPEQKSLLPRLFELYENSFHATHANAPTDQTVLSILSYLLGEKLSAIHIGSLRNIEIQSQNGNKKLSLGNIETIFNKVYENGFSVGIAGWHLPYCYFSSQIKAACHQFGSSKYNYITSSGFLGTIRAQLRSFLPDWYSYEHLHIYKYFLEDAKELILNKDLNFVYLHFPIPHPPQIYDPFLMKEKSFNSNPAGYDANLALVEKSYSEIERLLKENQMWENSIVIITADHWKRVPREYFSFHSEVPFIIKLENKYRSAFAYNPVMSSILVRDLILPLLKGEINSAEDLASFITKEAHKYPTAPLITN